MKQLLINKESLERNGHEIVDGTTLLIKATKDNRMAGKMIPMNGAFLDVELGLQALQGSNVQFLINLDRSLQNVILGSFYTHGEGKYLRLNMFNHAGSATTLKEGQVIASVSFVEPMKLLAVEAPKDGFKLVEKKVKSNDAGTIEKKPAAKKAPAKKPAAKRKRTTRKKKEE